MELILKHSSVEYCCVLIVDNAVYLFKYHHVCNHHSISKALNKYLFSYFMIMI